METRDIALRGVEVVPAHNTVIGGEHRNHAGTIHADEHREVFDHVQLVANQLHDAVQAGNREIGRAVDVRLDADQVIVGVGFSVDFVGLVLLEGHKELNSGFQHWKFSFRLWAYARLKLRILGETCSEPSRAI